MAKKKNRNVSKNIPNGTVLHTRDEYINGSQNYRKPGYQNKGNYRKVAVVDSNRHDDLAVVKLTTKGKGLPGEKSTYKPFVETLDDKGKPIRISSKFISRGAKLSKQAVSIIKKDSFKDAHTRKSNRRKVRDMKGRK